MEQGEFGGTTELVVFTGGRDQNDGSSGDSARRCWMMDISTAMGHGWRWAMGGLLETTGVLVGEPVAVHDNAMPYLTNHLLHFFSSQSVPTNIRRRPVSSTKLRNARGGGGRFGMYPSERTHASQGKQTQPHGKATRDTQRTNERQHGTKRAILPRNEPRS